jgi:AraC-like DNA-binding protein
VLGHVLSRENGRHKLEFTEDPASLNTRFCHSPLSKRLSLNYFRYGGPVAVDAEIGEFILVQIPLEGDALVRNTGQEVYSKPGTGVVVSSNSDMYMAFQEDTERIVARISRPALERHLQNHIGREVDRPIRFQLQLETPANQPFGISDTVLRIVQELDGEMGISPLAVPCLEDLLMSLLLAMQPHNYQEQLVGDPYTPAKSYYVRRAEQFMRANVARPISMDDLVSETGVSARSLYAGFQRTHSMSPMGYLKSLRLRQIHDELLAADPASSSVTGIASSWGFLHFGNFAGDYRKKFGEKPSETLRRHRTGVTH